MSGYELQNKLLDFINCILILILLDATLVPVVPPTNERRGILMSCPERPILKKDYDRLFKDSNWEVRIDIWF